MKGFLVENSCTGVKGPIQETLLGDFEMNIILLIFSQYISTLFCKYVISCGFPQNLPSGELLNTI